jgi:hypothetical protein
MAYTVTNLVTDAFYASGIVSRDFEQPTGSQFEVGLNALNSVVSDKAIESDMIPYYTKYSFNAVNGVETYFIPGLETADTLVFFLSGVRYQMREVHRIQFRGSPRADINSLPFNWNLERCTGGALISLYFFPDRNYPLELWGLFRLPQLTFNQDLQNSTATANLGICNVTGTGTLSSGQFLINNVNIVNLSFANPAALVAQINTGIVPNVTASIETGDFILTCTQGPGITVFTDGTADPLNSVSFSNFSTISSPNTLNFNTFSLDQFYISYLKFCLADRLCSEYNFIAPPGVVKQLEQYQRWISKRSGGMDLTTQLTSTLSSSNPINYAQANIGKGWTT